MQRPASTCRSPIRRPGPASRPGGCRTRRRPRRGSRRAAAGGAAPHREVLLEAAHRDQRLRRAAHTVVAIGAAGRPPGRLRARSAASSGRDGRAPARRSRPGIAQAAGLGQIAARAKGAAGGRAPLRVGRRARGSRAAAPSGRDARRGSPPAGRRCRDAAAAERRRRPRRTRRIWPAYITSDPVGRLRPRRRGRG